MVINTRANGKLKHIISQDGAYKWYLLFHTLYHQRKTAIAQLTMHGHYTSYIQTNINHQTHLKTKTKTVIVLKKTRADIAYVKCNNLVHLNLVI